MKREALDHPKTGALARLLGWSRYRTWGLLEGLFGYVATWHPDGRLTDSKWLEFCGWAEIEDPEGVLHAMLEVAYLDRESPGNTGNLSVHDWIEHCDRHVKRKLAERGDPRIPMGYARTTHAIRTGIPCGAPPEPEPEPEPEFFSPGDSELPPESEPLGTFARDSEISSTRSRPKAPTGERRAALVARFELWWSAYPRRRTAGGSPTRGSREQALQRWLGMSDRDRAAAEDGLEQYAKLAGGFPVDAVRYLRHERWSDAAAAKRDAADGLTWWEQQDARFKAERRAKETP